MPVRPGRHADSSPARSYQAPPATWPELAGQPRPWPAGSSGLPGPPEFAAGEPATVAFDAPTDLAGLRVDVPAWSTRESSPASRRRSAGPSALRFIWIYPDLLSTYGDRGNLVMLTRRAALRGLPVEPVGINSDQQVPRQGDIYLLGGGEDLPQILAAKRLRVDGGLAAAAANGAVIFAVCAGYQLVGEGFGGLDGEPV